MAGYKLFRFIQAEGLQASLPQVCLSIELIAAFIRFMTTLDMEGWNGWWSDVGVRILYAIEVPSPIITSMIISLYW